MERSETAKKLMILADFLDHLDLEKFTYNQWVRFRVGIERTEKPVEEAETCTSQACALGWAVVHPQLRRHDVALLKGVGGVHVLDEYGDWRGNEYWAADRLFGLGTKETDYLFFPQTSDNIDYWGNDSITNERDFGPKEVAAKIRHFLRKEYSDVM